MEQVTYLHHRWLCRDRRPDVWGEIVVGKMRSYHATLAIASSTENIFGVKVRVGIALCGLHDRFSRSQGRYVAKLRLDMVPIRSQINEWAAGSPYYFEFECANNAHVKRTAWQRFLELCIESNCRTLGTGGPELPSWMGEALLGRKVRSK